MIVLGLTGSIGMGKSTTARMFAEEGCTVIDADAIVHDLYAREAVAPVEEAFPGVTVDGAIDRPRLSRRVLGDPDALKRLEGIVHPLVRAEQGRRLERAREAGARIAVLDVPLLFETGRADDMDAVVVVTAPAQIQAERVLAREGMSEEKFNAILAKQMPDTQKRARAHFIVDTGAGFAEARAAVRAVCRAARQLG